MFCLLVHYGNCRDLTKWSLIFQGCGTELVNFFERSMMLMVVTALGIGALQVRRHHHMSSDTTCLVYLVMSLNCDKTCVCSHLCSVMFCFLVVFGNVVFNDALLCYAEVQGRWL